MKAAKHISVSGNAVPSRKCAAQSNHEMIEHALTGAIPSRSTRKRSALKQFAPVRHPEIKMARIC